MRRLAGLIFLLAACDHTTAPSAALGTCFLSSIDGKPLPAAPQEFPAGSVVQSGSLAFDAGQRPHENPGTVDYTLVVQQNGSAPEIRRVTLWYTMTGNVVSINTCPPGALCLVAEELTGPLVGNTLTLTHYFAGAPRSVYRFYRQLPD
jgi:hypothetical protein